MGVAGKPYPTDLTDLTDGQRELVRVVIPEAGRASPVGGPAGGHQPLLHRNRSGCRWGVLPHDPPAKSTVYECVAAWRGDGT
jgi:putative transposase